MNQYNKRNRNNEPKVKDTYKLCMKESQGQNDGKTVKLEIVTSALEMHKYTGKTQAKWDRKKKRNYEKEMEYYVKVR